VGPVGTGHAREGRQTNTWLAFGAEAVDAFGCARTPVWVSTTKTMIDALEAGPLVSSVAIGQAPTGS